MRSGPENVLVAVDIVDVGGAVVVARVLGVGPALVRVAFLDLGLHGGRPQAVGARLLLDERLPRVLAGAEVAAVQLLLLNREPGIRVVRVVGPDEPDEH